MRRHFGCLGAVCVRSVRPRRRSDHSDATDATGAERSSCVPWHSFVPGASDHVVARSTVVPRTDLSMILASIRQLRGSSGVQNTCTVCGNEFQASKPSSENFIFLTFGAGSIPHMFCFLEVRLVLCVLSTRRGTLRYTFWKQNKYVFK